MNPEPSVLWRTVDRRLVLDRSPFARIFDEDVQLPDGSLITNWMRVAIPEFVITFAYLDDGRVPMVRQFRQAVGGYTLELPSGHIEHGEERLVAAQRELREEAGVEADEWRFMGRYVMDTNRECGWANVFFAKGARIVGAPNHGDLGEMTLHWLSLSEVRRAFEASEFICAPTALAVGAALNQLLKYTNPT